MIQNPYAPANFFTNADMSMSQQSDTINKLGYSKVGLVFNWTGTPTGTFAVLVANQNDITKAVSLTLSGLTPPFTQPSGSPAAVELSLDNINEEFMWVTYTFGSGSGFVTGSVVVNK